MIADFTAERLVRDAASGDRDAFAALIGRHQSMVFGLAWNFLHDRSAAEELAQEVFVELHRALPSLESAAHVTNWLRRVTTNRCVDYSRYRRARPQVSLDSVEEPVALPSADDVLLSEKVRKLTASLPERARAVLLLRYQEDLEPTEISEMLGMPVNTVKSHLQRSLAMLREKLSRSGVKR